MNKEIQKNREALIRMLFSRDENSRGLWYHKSNSDCLCVKGVANSMMLSDEEYCADFRKFNSKNCSYVPDMFGMSLDVWNEMEGRFEGCGKYHRHSYIEIAQGLQSLPGWPTVL